MATAFVIDGAYFLRRLRWTFPHIDHKDPTKVVDSLWRLVRWHMQFNPAFRRDRDTGVHSMESPELHRIFFYDCPPLTKKMHRPISRQAIDLSKTDEAQLRLAVHRELRETRKVAVRLGRLNDASEWRLTVDAVKRLRSGVVAPLTDADFEIDTKQKGVDMKLGLDVATLAFKRQVGQIVLIAGDADFVPAAKLARREGIDVVLETMGRDAPEDLHANVDGVRHYEEDRKQP
ncbi:NYN domain-containing protein [Sphingomonas sp. RP10(2022)]|uniref:NYN domain-containing protein n=1 Tax=Sphingomonas liriopis TaxID=2949094 RepID=A0A9X2KP65_9SPHN|nr:NYN domain-containing protein [Sphingomonas liriopis]MCP3734379.1 NYN domain-containing protein [Sphingomonas liriopis]